MHLTLHDMLHLTGVYQLDHVIYLLTSHMGQHTKTRGLRVGARVTLRHIVPLMRHHKVRGASSAVFAFPWMCLLLMWRVSVPCAITHGWA